LSDGVNPLKTKQLNTISYKDNREETITIAIPSPEKDYMGIITDL
jgi:hypothetical protein